MIHAVKGFGIVNKTEVDVFLESLAFSMIQQMLAFGSLVPLLEHLDILSSRTVEASLGEF